MYVLIMHLDGQVIYTRRDGVTIIEMWKRGEITGTGTGTGNYRVAQKNFLWFLLYGNS